MVTTTSTQEIQEHTVQLLQEVNDLSAAVATDEEQYLRLRWQVCDTLIQSLKPLLKYLDQILTNVPEQPRGLWLGCVALLRNGQIYVGIDQTYYLSMEQAKSSLLGTPHTDLTDFDAEEVISHSLMVDLFRAMDRALKLQEERRLRMASGRENIQAVIEALQSGRS